jgi:hypothetical protein
VAIHGIIQGLCKPHLLPELSVQRTRPFSIHNCTHYHDCQNDVTAAFKHCHKISHEI